MSELQKINIDGVEYDFSTFTEQQKAMVGQLTDIAQKLGGLQFQADQLSMARDGFMSILKQSLEAKPPSE